MNLLEKYNDIIVIKYRAYGDRNCTGVGPPKMHNIVKTY